MARGSAEVLVTMQLAAAEAVGRFVARHPERRSELEDEYLRFALATARAAPLRPPGNWASAYSDSD